jgi:hypothetical protein
VTEQKPAKDRGSSSFPTIVAALIGAVATVAAAVLGNVGSFTKILPGSPTRTVTTGPLHAGGIYHEGRLVLTSGSDQADLDAPPTDPQWGVLNLTPGHMYDISFPGSAELYLESNAQGVQLNQATNNSCINATGYTTSTLGVNTPPLRVGQYICVHTPEGHFSLLKVLNLQASRVTFFVETFKNP